VNVFTGRARMTFEEEAFRTAAHVEQAADALGVGMRLEAGGQNDHVDRNPPDHTSQRILHADDEFAFLLRNESPVGHLAHATADEMHPFFKQLVVEFLVAFAGARMSM